MSESTPQFVYREAGADGFDALKDLWEKLNSHHAQISPRFGSELRLRTFEARKQELIAKGDKGRLGADIVTVGSEETGVAYCISTVSVDGTGEIDSLFVEEHWRGEGIGTELMRRALAWLDRMGATTKVVSVMFENDEALAFYRRFGFHPRTVLMQESKHLGSPEPARIG